MIHVLGLLIMNRVNKNIGVIGHIVNSAQATFRNSVPVILEKINAVFSDLQFCELVFQPLAHL